MSAKAPQDREAAAERLIGFAQGTFHYQAWRGEAPTGVPTLRRDLLAALAVTPSTPRAATDGDGLRMTIEAILRERLNPEDDDDLADVVEPLMAALATPPAASVSAAEAEVERLRAALERIERWFGEFPPTGRCWENADGTTSDRPMSYGAEFGSNGERDYMRSVARQALAQADGGAG